LAQFDQFADHELTDRGTETNLAAANIVVEEFENLSLRGKVSFLARLLYTSCKQDASVVVCLVCSALNKLYSLMFTSFWLLFITSFVGTKI